MDDKKEGRPLSFKSVEELDEAVEQYFSKDGDAWVLDGEAKKFMPTMSGLALALNVDRKTITNYANKEEYFPTIKKARTRVEQALEQRLYFGQPVGAIFNLKNNFGWNDKQQLETSEMVKDTGENEW